MISLPKILHDDTVTILKTTSGAVDDDGVPTTTTTEHEWKNVNVQQLTADELTDQGRETNVTIWRVSGPPPPVALEASDRIMWRGGKYREIDGQPDARAGKYRIQHTSLQMVRATG